jgi:hypothetical protein
MNTLTITRRELRAQSFVFIAAAAFALIPFVALIPGVSHSTDGVAAFAPIVAAGFTLGLAAILGVTMIGRELSEGRLSFYFSRPVSPSAIWFGKLTSAVITIVACAAIILIPSMLVAGRTFAQFWPNAGAFAGILIVSAILLLLLAHALSTMVRARSAWIALDFLCAIAVIAIVMACVLPLVWHGAMSLVLGIAAAIGLALPVALIGGGAWQLSRGRTDPVRSHRQLSAFLWTSLGVVLAIVAGYAAWATSAGPADIKRPGYSVDSSRGEWMYIGGYAKHRADYAVSFLYNVQDGRYLRDFSPDILGSVGTVSPDATAALMGVPSSALQAFRARRAGNFSFAEVPFEVKLARLDAPSISPVGTGLLIHAGRDSLAVSNGGRRIAILRWNVVTVYDVQTRHTVGSARIPMKDGWRPEMELINDDVVRLVKRDKLGSRATEGPAMWTVTVFDFDAAHRTVHKVASVDAFGKYVWTGQSADHSKLLIRPNDRWADPSPKPWPIIVADLTGSGRTISVLPAHGGTLHSAMLLGDGRLAVVELANGHALLRLLGGDGTLQHETDLGAAEGASLSGLTAGKIVLGTTSNRNNGNGRGWTLHVVDPATGAIVRTLPNLRPLTRLPLGIAASPADVPYHPFLDETGAIVKVNAVTGERATIVPG